MTFETKGPATLPNACVWRPDLSFAPAPLCPAGGAPEVEAFPELDATARDEALQCIGRLQDDRLHVRQTTAMRLAGLGPGVIPLLEPVLRGGCCLHEIDAALETLKRLRDARSIPITAALLASPSEDIRLAALKTLRWLTDDPDTFLPELSDPYWRIRREALFALLELRCDGLMRVIEAMLRDGHAAVRAAAANGPGIIRDESAIPALIELLDDPAKPVREMAAWSLGRFERRMVGEHAADLALHPASRRDVALACRTLCICRDPAAADAVILAAEHADSETQVKAVKALAGMAGPEHMPFLKSMLQSDAETVRQAAAWAISLRTLRGASRRTAE